MEFQVHYTASPFSMERKERMTFVEFKKVPIKKEKKKKNDK